MNSTNRQRVHLWQLIALSNAPPQTHHLSSCHACRIGRLMELHRTYSVISPFQVFRTLASVAMNQRPFSSYFHPSYIWETHVLLQCRHGDTVLLIDKRKNTVNDNPTRHPRLVLGVAVGGAPWGKCRSWRASARKSRLESGGNWVRESDQC